MGFIIFFYGIMINIFYSYFGVVFVSSHSNRGSNIKLVKSGARRTETVKSVAQVEDKFSIKKLGDEDFSFDASAVDISERMKLLYKEYVMFLGVVSSLSEFNTSNDDVETAVFSFIHRSRNANLYVDEALNSRRGAGRGHSKLLDKLVDAGVFTKRKTNGSSSYFLTSLGEDLADADDVFGGTGLFELSGADLRNAPSFFNSNAEKVVFRGQELFGGIDGTWDRIDGLKNKFAAYVFVGDDGFRAKEGLVHKSFEPASGENKDLITGMFYRGLQANVPVRLQFADLYNPKNLYAPFKFNGENMFLAINEGVVGRFLFHYGDGVELRINQEQLQYFNNELVKGARSEKHREESVLLERAGMWRLPVEISVSVNGVLKGVIIGRLYTKQFDEYMDTYNPHANRKGYFRQMLERFALLQTEDAPSKLPKKTNSIPF